MCNFRLLALLAALVLASLAGASAQTCRQLTKDTATVAELELFNSFDHIFRCEGVANIQVNLLWTTLVATTNCGDAPFKMFLGETPEELKLQLVNESVVACHRLPGKGSCTFKLSPFFSTHLIGYKVKSFRGFLGGSAVTKCDLHTSIVRDKLMVLEFFAGAVLVLFGEALSNSFALRIVASAAFCASTSVIFVVFMVRRALFLGDVLYVWWMVKQATGTYFPTTNEVVLSPYLWAYVGFWATVGATFMYRTGAGMNKPRIATVLRVTFKMLGLMLLYDGTWTNETVFAVLTTLSIMYWTITSSFWYPWNWARWMIKLVPSFSSSQHDEFPYSKSAVGCWKEEDPCERKPVKAAAAVAAARSQEKGFKVHELAKIGFYMSPRGRLVGLGSHEFKGLLKKGYEPNVRTARMEKGMSYPA